MELSHNDRRFCVYFYEQISTGYIVYVGNGTYERPYATKYRRPRAIKQMRLEKDLNIFIAFHNLTKREAEQIESEYLDNYLGVESEHFRLKNKAKSSKVKSISFEEMSKYFYYSEDSPTYLRWKIDSVGRKSSLLNKQAGCVSIRKNRRNSYSIVRVNGVSYACHRIVYCLESKCDVDIDMVVDHIDGDGLNNRPENLRLVTRQVNVSNTRRAEIQSNNKTGVRGVSYNKGGYYIASLGFRILGERKVMTRCFKVATLGEEEAFRLACKARLELEQIRDSVLKQI